MGSEGYREAEAKFVYWTFEAKFSSETSQFGSSFTSSFFFNVYVSMVSTVRKRGQL